MEGATLSVRPGDGGMPGPGTGLQPEEHLRTVRRAVARQAAAIVTLPEVIAAAAGPRGFRAWDWHHVRTPRLVVSRGGSAVCRPDFHGPRRSATVDTGFPRRPMPSRDLGRIPTADPARISSTRVLVGVGGIPGRKQPYPAAVYRTGALGEGLDLLVDVCGGWISPAPARAQRDMVQGGGTATAAVAKSRLPYPHPRGRSHHLVTAGLPARRPLPPDIPRAPGCRYKSHAGRGARPQGRRW
jgi:hypothetical protein